MHRILLVRFSAMGDLLLTTPLLRALRARHPEAHIAVVTRADMADTLRNNPRLDQLITLQRDGSVRELAAQLRSERWTHRLDLHRSLRSRALRLLVGGRWTTYPKHRVRRKLIIATHRRMGGQLGHVAERYFAAARELDVHPDGGPAEFFPTDAMRAHVHEMLAQRELGTSRPLLALAPGAAHFTKRWPARHWNVLAERLALTHDLVIVGGEQDRDTANEIATHAGGRAWAAAGEFTLDGTGAILERCTRLIAGDTGVLHLATAVGTPVVGLYGPTVREFGFFPYHARYIAVERDMRCRPCSSQGGPVCPLGHHRCLGGLEPDTVLDAMAAL